ncbi:MAG: AraC-like DNA-binding protein [Arenicella sp.]|jgi:AraC-like DNA-binding protein
MVFNFSEETGFLKQTTLITPIFTLITGPAFYLFVKHLVYSDAQWRTRDLYHFLPAILSIPFTAYTQHVIAAGSLSLVIYGVASYRLLNKYSRASKQMSSAALDMRLNWLRAIIWIFAVLGLLDTIRLNLQPELDYLLLNSWYLLHQLCVLIVYACLIWFALRQPLLFDGLASFDESSTMQKERGLSDLLFSQINHELVASELFKQQRLSLIDVANHFEIGVKDISGAVNTGSGLNFCEYVNSLRVADVKQKIDENTDRKLTLLELAFESGFNSKSSFNSCFKNSTGLTPSQYQRQRLHKQNSA